MSLVQTLTGCGHRQGASARQPLNVASFGLLRNIVLYVVSGHRCALRSGCRLIPADSVVASAMFVVVHSSRATVGVAMSKRLFAVFLALFLLLVGCGSSGPGTKTLPSSTATTSQTATTVASPATIGSRSTTTLASAAVGKWTTPTVVGTSSPTLVVVGCASATFCVAVDQGHHTFTFNGSSWSDAAATEPTGNPNAMSCPSATTCVLTDSQGRFAVFAGSAWAAPGLVSKAGLVDGSSCPTLTFCMAVDAAGNAISYNGSTWSALQAIDPIAAKTTNDINAGKPGDLINLRVSCPTVSFCAAIDTAGNAMTFNGSGWTTPVAVNAGTKPVASSLSCASSTFCVASKGSTYVVFDGSSWGTVKSFGKNASFDHVACPSAGFCMATNQSTWATFDGTAWSLPSPGATQVNSALAMTCPTNDFCVTVGAYGNVSQYAK